MNRISNTLGGNTRGRWGLVLLALTLFAGCTNSRPKDVPPQGQEPAQEQTVEFWKLDYRQLTGTDELKIATYNLLNFFNADHDRDELGNEKDDFTFLPSGFPGKKDRCEAMDSGYYKTQCLETDWMPWRVQLKYRQVQRAIDAQGDLPDLLAVQEIENGEIAAGIADTLGFDSFQITNSPDERGIDVALLYKATKLKFLEREEIVLTKQDDPYFEKKPTRNLLRVHFKVLGAPSDVVLGVYANHWPSNGNPGEARVAAAKALQRTIDVQTAKIGKDKYYVVVLGDFNTLEGQTPNPFDDVVENASWDNALVDAQKLALANKAHPFRNSMPKNSYWYHTKNSWDKLDRILFSQNFVDGSGALDLRSETFRIVGAAELTHEYTLKSNKPDVPPKTIRVPLDYDFSYPATEEEAPLADPQKLGFSDHLPVVVKVQIRK